MASSSCADATNATICDNDWVILIQEGKDSRVINVKKDAKVHIGKSPVPMSPLIGTPFGALMKLEKNQLVRANTTIEEALGTKDQFVWATATAVDQLEKSNKDLVDTNTSQQLSQEDIHQLKKEGKAEEIVQALVAGSKTFEGKTEFSQQKYLKKKIQKYMQFVKAVRPTAIGLCDLYVNKSADKICELRSDSLALLLTLSNVHAGSRALVVDETSVGLAVGALAQRMGGHGLMLYCHQGGNAHVETMRWLNLGPACWHSSHACPLYSFLQALEPAAEDASTQEDGANAEEAPAAVAPASAEAMDLEPKDLESQGAMAPAVDEKAVADARAERGGPDRLKIGRPSLIQVKDMIAEGFDSLVYVCKTSPLPLLPSLLKCLAPSATFVLYCPSIQPLAQCMYECQRSGTAINMQLIETWMREQQVAPSRTHPKMNGFPPTGFILYGTTVATSELGTLEAPTEESADTATGTSNRHTKRQRTGRRR